MRYYDKKPYLTATTPSPTVSSLQDMLSETGFLLTNALGLLASLMGDKEQKLSPQDHGNGA